jgi:hypothetical protein
VREGPFVFRLSPTPHFLLPISCFPLPAFLTFADRPDPSGATRAARINDVFVA